MTMQKLGIMATAIVILVAILATSQSDAIGPGESSRPKPNARPTKKSAPKLKRKRVFVTDYGAPRLRYRPRTLNYAIGADVLKRISWDAWGGPAAKGSGILEWNYCNPDCAAATIEDFAVTVTLSRRRNCHGYRRYTRLRWRFVDAKPDPVKENPTQRIFTRKPMRCPR